MDATDLSPDRGKIIEAPDLICAISELDVATAFITKGDEVSVAAIVF